MSEILIEIAEPLVQGLSIPEEFATYRASLSLAAAIWNASRLSGKEARRGAVEHIVETLVAEMECAPEEARQAVGAVYLCARQHYGSEKRLIEGVTVEHVEGTRCQVQVKSAEVEEV